MKEIIVKFEPFVFRQTIFIKDLDSGEVKEQHIPQKELSSYISLLNEDVKKVHFFGNEKFAEKIKEECLTKYKMNTNTEIIINK